MVSSLVILALASAAAALKVTSPTSSDVWTTGESQTITWDTVSTDQDTFNIYLSNMASYPSTTILLASDVSSSDGSASIDGSKLTTGTAFTINFTNGTETEQIYAQSNQFNITEGSTSSSSSASASTTSSASSSSSGTSTTATTLAQVTSSGSAATASGGATKATPSGSAGANHLNGTATGSSTATATGSSSTASGSSTATGSSTGSSASSTSSSSTSTSGAGKIVAGWMVMAAAAVMAL